MKIKKFLFFIIMLFLICNCLITKKTNHITRMKMEKISGNQPFLLIKIENDNNVVSKELILMIYNIHKSIINQIKINDIDTSCFLNEEIIIVKEDNLIVSEINEAFDITNLESEQLNEINNLITQKYFIRNTFDTENNTAYLILNFPISIITNKQKINRIFDKVIKIIQTENPYDKYNVYIFNTKINNKTTYKNINNKYISLNIILNTDKVNGVVQPEILNIIHNIKTECSELEGISFSSSISESIITLNNLLNDQNNNIIPDNKHLIQQLLLLLELSDGNTHNLINIDKSRAEIQIIVDNMSSRQYFKILTKIDQITEKYKSYFDKIYIYREDI